jgi:hypothetical protein
MTKKKKKKDFKKEEKKEYCKQSKNPNTFRNRDDDIELI